MENNYHTNMATIEQKCEKLAKILETAADKLRDPDIGVEVWQKEGHAIQSLIAQLTTVLSRAKKISNSANYKKKKSEIEEWPDTIS
jgi:hypothetical protein